MDGGGHVRRPGRDKEYGFRKWEEGMASEVESGYTQGLNITNLSKSMSNMLLLIPLCRLCTVGLSQ